MWHFVNGREKRIDIGYFLHYTADMYVLNDDDFEKLAELWQKTHKTEGSALEIQHLLMEMTGVKQIQGIRILTAFSENGAIEMFLGRMILLKKNLILFQPADDVYSGGKWALCAGIMQSGGGLVLVSTKCFMGSDVEFKIYRSTHALRVSWGGGERMSEWGGVESFSETQWRELSPWLNQWLPREEEKPQTKSSR